MTVPLTTTLNRIYACRPCPGGWREGLAAAGKAADDEPVSYEQILDRAGLDNALWCARAEPQNSRQWRRFAVWCARRCQYLMKDQRSINALDVAERHAGGRATDEDLRAAAAAAAVAAAATADAAAAAAAVAAAADAATAAAAVAAAAAAAAYAYADDDAAAYAYADERAAQAAAFRQLVTTGTLP
jgi:hypothetical protein